MARGLPLAGPPRVSATPARCADHRSRRARIPDRKSTSLNSTHSLHDALPIWSWRSPLTDGEGSSIGRTAAGIGDAGALRRPSIATGSDPRSEEHKSELHSLPTRRSSDLVVALSADGWRGVFHWPDRRGYRRRRRAAQTIDRDGLGSQIGRAQV